MDDKKILVIQCSVRFDWPENYFFLAAFFAGALVAVLATLAFLTALAGALVAAFLLLEDLSLVVASAAATGLLFLPFQRLVPNRLHTFVWCPRA